MDINKTKDRFILGLDLGSATSAIAYFDESKKLPTTINISGGYGNATMPTVVQYANDSDQWIVGEYALLNQGEKNSTVVINFLENIGKRHFATVKGNKISLVDIFAVFLQELVIKIPKNINPTAEIAGIMVSVPDYYVDIEAFKEAFLKAGLLDKVIDFVPYSHSVFYHHYYNKKVIKENILMLDFGGTTLKAGIYSAINNDINLLTYQKHETLGTTLIENYLEDVFTKEYLNRLDKLILTEEETASIKSLVYEYKNAFFKKAATAKGLKVYFNFANPPFEFRITKENIDTIIMPFKEEFKSFLKNLHKQLDNLGKPLNIGTVICTGGGFKMDWSLDATKELFASSNIVSYTNPKIIAAEGVAILAAKELGVIKKDLSINFTSSYSIVGNVGIYAQDGFMPIIKKGQIIPFKQYRATVIIAQETEYSSTIIDILQETKEAYQTIGQIKIPIIKRPLRTTKLKLIFEFFRTDTMRVRVVDLGFGEFFLPSGFDKTYEIKLYSV